MKTLKDVVFRMVANRRGISACLALGDRERVIGASGSRTGECTRLLRSSVILGQCGKPHSV